MSLSESMYSYLTDLVDVSVYCGTFDQDVELPAVIFTVIDLEYGHTLNETTQFALARVQIDSVSTLLSEAETNANTIRSTLDAFHGDLDDTTILYSIADSSRHLHQPPSEGANEWTYRVSTDYLLRHAV